MHLRYKIHFLHLFTLNQSDCVISIGIRGMYKFIMQYEKGSDLFQEQYEFLHRCLALALTSTHDVIYRNTLLSEQPRPDAYFERLRQVHIAYKQFFKIAPNIKTRE